MNSSVPSNMTRQAMVAHRAVAVVRQAVGEGADVITAASIGESLAVSGRTVQRSVRAVLGRSLRTIIAEQRVQRALVLVQTTPMPLAHVASAVGYGGQNRMNEAFRTWMRTSPGSLRRACQSTSAGRRRKKRRP
jgi:transcriptional regulator GlxA family with amidase domain